MENYYFNCHQCGKCCNSGPEIEFSEILKQSLNFPLAVKLRVSKGYEKYQKELVLANPEQFLENEGYLISFQVFGYNYTTIEKCPQLNENGSCNIYIDRPNICKLVPGNTFDKKVVKIINEDNYNFFQAQGCIKNAKEINFEPIYENGELKEKYAKFFDFSKKDKLAYSKERIGFIQILKHYIPNLYEKYSSVYLTINLAMLLSILYHENRISHEDYRTILNNQVIVLNEIINNAIIRKTKKI